MAGYDRYAPGLERAREEARQMGLDNVRFEHDDSVGYCVQTSLSDDATGVQVSSLISNR